MIVMTTTNLSFIKNITKDTLTGNEKFQVPLNNYEDLESTTRKSLYGKAKIVRGFSFIALTSYQRPIMIIDDDGNITVDSQYYNFSVTTIRHEREFVKHALAIGYIKPNDGCDYRNDDTVTTKTANQILREIDKTI